MTANLIIGGGAVVLAVGMLLIGVACADAIRGLGWLLADWARGLRAPAPVYVPVYEGVPAYGPPVTPPQGTEVVRGDGVLKVRADLPAQRKLTEDHAPTCDFPAVGYTPPPASWTDPPPTLEELRAQYDSWQETVYGEQAQLAIEPGLAGRQDAGLLS